MKKLDLILILKRRKNIKKRELRLLKKVFKIFMKKG